MLTFLWVASRRGLEVTSYVDEAIGRMTKNERGVPWVSKVVLHPRVAYAGAHPTQEIEEELHHQAHEACYIANSVKTEITVAPNL
jgi:organic hydroperoxide reductase OsmC/OhrA